MDFEKLFSGGNGHENKPLPEPTAEIRLAEDEGPWTEAQVMGLTCNPVYAGVGPFPQIISDELWVSANVRMIEGEKISLEQFLVNMLYALRESL